MRWYNIDDEKHEPPYDLEILVSNGNELDHHAEVVKRASDYNGRMTFEDKFGYMIDFYPLYWANINIPEP